MKGTPRGLFFTAAKPVKKHTGPFAPLPQENKPAEFNAKAAIFIVGGSCITQSSACEPPP